MVIAFVALYSVIIPLVAHMSLLVNAITLNKHFHLQFVFQSDCFIGCEHNDRILV